MKPVDQEFLHDPANGQHGDCLRACVASLIEVPAAEVPHVAQLFPNDARAAWNHLYDFLEARGYCYVPGRKTIIEGQYHIISGPSPRNKGTHAVIGLDGKIVFDPHPSRAGLAGTPAEWINSYLIKETA